MKIIRSVFKNIFLAILSILVFGIIFWGPVHILIQSWQLFQVHGNTTDGLLQSVDAVYGRHGSSTRVKFSYEVNNKIYFSDNLAPGFESVGYTGGGDTAKDFKAGSPVLVYYDARSPSFSFLIYGWPKTTIGYTLFIWGWIIGNPLINLLGKKRYHFEYTEQYSLPVTGFIVLAYFPNYITPSKLIYIFFVWIAVGIIFCLIEYLKYRKRIISQPSDSPDHADW